MKRTTTIVAALVGLVVLAPAAWADGSSSDTSAPPATTSTVTDSSTSTTTSTPTTSTPTTTSTEVVPSTTTTTTTTVPTTDGVGTCTTDCIPEDTDTCADCIPSTGGGIPTAVAGTGYGAGSLPFTGVEDTIAAVLLALVVVLGGVVAWRWAQLRESVAIDASRARPLPAKEKRSGYADALRRQVIEQRARQVFTPRVA